MSELSRIHPIELPADELDGPGSFEYRLIKAHRRTDGTLKSDQLVRSDYLRRTDELLRQMTEGVDVLERVVPEPSEEVVSGEEVSGAEPKEAPDSAPVYKMVTRKPDEVVFLDKSARPVAWLAGEMWESFAALPGEETPKKPSFSFVNIDRNQWVNAIDPDGTGIVDVDRLDPSVVRSLRSIYVSPADKRDGLTEDIDTAPATLDDKTVLIVDEVRSTGRTLDIATAFFKEAFPTARVAGTHWMGGAIMKNGAMGNADLPVWYKEDSPLGRGIANRDPIASQASPNITQRLGGWFLGRRLAEPDPASEQLRVEMRHLAHDDNVLFIPSTLRDEDDYIARAETFNGMTLPEYASEKRHLNSTDRSR